MSAATSIITLPSRQGNLFAVVNDTNYKKFCVFHAEFPKVYELFERFSLNLIQRGRTKLGAKMIIERIRWEMATDGSRDAEGLKINNNYTCYYSRLFVERHPQYKEYFDFREVKN
jgi:hypothetical protein